MVIGERLPRCQSGDSSGQSRVSSASEPRRRCVGRPRCGDAAVCQLDYDGAPLVGWTPDAGACFYGASFTARPCCLHSSSLLSSQLVLGLGLGAAARERLVHLNDVVGVHGVAVFIDERWLGALAEQQLHHLNVRGRGAREHVVAQLAVGRGGVLLQCLFDVLGDSLQSIEGGAQRRLSTEVQCRHRRARSEQGAHGTHVRLPRGHVKRRGAVFGGGVDDRREQLRLVLEGLGDELDATHAARCSEHH
eukprot:scaffold45359_cov60-Phaeocystis_antarctica.AAC.3